MSFQKKIGLNKPKQLNVGYATWLIVVLNIMIRSNHKDCAYRKKVIKFVKNHIEEINESKYLNKTRKFQMNLLIRCYVIYVITYKMYLKIYRK